MHTRSLLLPLAMAAFILSGCSGEKTANTNPAPPTNNNAATSGFRVGMVTDIAGINDHSFNASAWRGMQKASQDFHFAPKAIETKAAADYQSNLEELANQKYDVVIAVGFSMGDALKTVAPKYPAVKFAIIDGDAPNLPNCVALKFREQEGSFLVGYLAGAVSKSGAVGFVGGIPGPLIKKFETGYKAGVLTANPKAKVTAVYVGSWTDKGKAKNLADTLFAQGSDVIYHAAGTAGDGVIQAAAEKGDGFYAIGVDSDQDWEAKGRVLTSMVKRVDNAVYDAIKRAKDGQFKSGTIVYGVKENGVGPSPMTYTKNKVNPMTLDTMNALSKMIVDGKLVPPATDAELAAFKTPKLPAQSGVTK